MSRGNEHDFTPARVDEQIENLLTSQGDTPQDAAGHQAVQQLQRLHQVRKDEHTPSLERVWQRVLTSEPLQTRETAVLEITEEQPMAEQQEETHQSGVLPSLDPRVARQRSGRGRRSFLTQMAAVLALVVLVGGFVFIITRNAAPHLQPTLLTRSSGSGLYAYHANAIYRVDNRTHQVVWKHLFANDESILGDPSFALVPNQPAVSGNILYLETQNTQHLGQQYLYALKPTDGSVLWRQLSTRALANSSMVYTLVEAKTSSSSTLTARDLRTGEQLWQRQYPIAGSRSDPGYGTESTDGFRLIAVTDQILYAVNVSRLNGQNFFTRYGLSPTDGSILWQKQEEISGSMPAISAQIVDGVIYTTEYNLKQVPPTVSSHGETVSEIPQSRAAAYDLATGHQRWQTPFMEGEQPNGGFGLSVGGNLLYFQTYNNSWPDSAAHPNSINTLHALSTTDGTVQWQYQKKNENDSMTSAVLVGDSLYTETHSITYVGTKQNIQLFVVALNAQTGKVRWSTPVKLLDGSEKTPTPIPHDIDPGSHGGYALDMAPVATTDTVYYSTPGQRVYAIQASNGAILTQFWVDRTAQTTVLDRLIFFVAL